MELWVELLVVTIAPLVVAVVTNQARSGTVKGLVLLGITAAVAFGNAWLENKGIVTEAVLVEIVRNFVVSVGIYFGVLKSAIAPKVAEATDKHGIGV